MPVTFLHDVTQAGCEPRWHQLMYAARGQFEIVTADQRQLVLADRAVWIPAGTRYTAELRAPIAVRSLFVAPAAVRRAPVRVRTLVVTPLLSELIAHIAKLGALDRRRAAHGRLFALWWDLVAAADEVPLALPLPLDARARRFADRVTRDPADVRSVGALAAASGVSTRTLERSFRAETGMTVGRWRRRVRLFHAARLLEVGTPVGTVAAAVGYATVSAFSHAFRGQFGHAPSRQVKRR